MWMAKWSSDLNVAVARDCGMELSCFVFTKDGPLFPVLKDLQKEALKRFSLAFKQFEQLLSLLSHNYIQVTSLS